MQSRDALRLKQEQRWTHWLKSGVSPLLERHWTAHGVTASEVKSLEDLHRLPCMTKDLLMQDQLQHPPYGSNLSRPLSDYVRMHQTSGTTTGQPLRWLDTATSWDWILHSWQTIYDVVGITRQDRFYFPFSFGPFLGFWAAFEGAARRGCLVLPGGGASTVARLRFLQENQATVLCSTPTYALRMLEVAREENVSLEKSAIRLLILAGEPGANIASTRHLIEAGWGARVIDHWGMTEVGPMGVECPENPTGFHFLEEECLIEVLEPGSNTPVKAGDEGELVITTLGRVHSPVVRYRTGDRVRLDTEPCPCGRVWKRALGGVIGRTDDMLLVKGNNFYPSMIESIVREIPAIHEFQIVTDARRPGELLLRLELRGHEPVQQVKQQVLESFKNRYNFRPELEFVGAGTLPRSEMKSSRVVRLK
jgi:phenylacetate-CoA ligase